MSEVPILIESVDFRHRNQRERTDATLFEKHLARRVRTRELTLTLSFFPHSRPRSLPFIHTRICRLHHPTPAIHVDPPCLPHFHMASPRRASPRRETMDAQTTRHPTFKRIMERSDQRSCGGAGKGETCEARRARERRAPSGQAREQGIKQGVVIRPVRKLVSNKNQKASIQHQ